MFSKKKKTKQENTKVIRNSDKIQKRNDIYDETKENINE